MSLTNENQDVRVPWWFNEESSRMLNGGYLLRGENLDGALERITSAAAKRLKRPDLKEKFKEIVWNGWMSLSSPIWANMGTQRGLPISCFGVNVPDSLNLISDKLKEVTMQTKIGGGTSGYFGNIRERGAKIKDNGESSGPVPFMQIFDTTMGVVSQGS